MTLHRLEALAQERADKLEARLKKRMEELEQERQLSAAPPQVIGGALVVPLCVMQKLMGEESPPPDIDQCIRKTIDRLAVEVVVEEEKRQRRSPWVVPLDATLRMVRILREAGEWFVRTPGNWYLSVA